MSEQVPPRGKLPTTSEESFRLLVESVRDYAIFMIDPKGIIMTWNAGAERLKLYKPEEIIGKHFSVFYPPEDLAWNKPGFELEETKRAGRFEDEGWRVRKDGSRFWANVVITALWDEHRTLRGFAKITRDLTERRKSEQERTARLAAEQASQAKDEFLAMLGHELRNPLAPIVTALQLMKLRDPGPRSKEQQILERQVRHMVRLVDDLLDVSRITRGKIELKKHPVDLRDVLAKAIETASPLLEQRNHHFEVQASDGPLFIDGDEARLVQIFANLLTNAAKYTDPGGHIRLRLSSSDDTVRFEVQDDGMGMPPELLPVVFDLFVQGKQGLDRSVGGLGIGLALVRSLVGLHGGTVEARSAGVGEGSTFIVTLPATRKEGPFAAVPPRPVSLPRSNGRRIMIVDDNVDALQMTREALGNAGNEVRTAEDGASALRLAREFKPTVAILDIGLPVMNGYELAARMREELGEETPQMIAVTGYGQSNDRSLSAAAGFREHLVKPVDLNRLLEAIDRAAALPVRMPA